MTDVGLVDRLREYNEDYIEQAMKHWDCWRAMIAKGFRGSLPRDGFESYLYGWQEDALEAARALETAAQKIQQLENECNELRAKANINKE